MEESATNENVDNTIMVANLNAIGGRGAGAKGATNTMMTFGDNVVLVEAAPQGWSSLDSCFLYR